jgi:hypothetical protein
MPSLFMPIYALQALRRTLDRVAPTTELETRSTTAMGTIADTAIGSAVGLAVVAAMFVAIWVAGDSSTRAGAAAADATQAPAALQSARNDRSPVTRTSITPEQLRALQEAEPPR